MNVKIINPCDAHMHWREGKTLQNIMTYSIQQFSGGLGMPNINGSITSLERLLLYRKEVEEELARNEDFYPLYTFYLSPALSKFDLMEAWEKKLIAGVKYYPKGGTTNSADGTLGFEEVSDLLETMQRLGIPLLIHGETPVVNGDLVDDFYREQVFLSEEMYTLRRKYLDLRIVLEHITTKEAAEFVIEYDNIWATITPQHLLLDRRAMFNYSEATPAGVVINTKKSGILPDYVCRPFLKEREHVLALHEALRWQAFNNKRKFGLGTDTAFHTKEKKYCACGACGFFTAPIALELYAMAFEKMGLLEHLPVFASEVMPEFYGIKDKLPKKVILLEKKPRKVELDYAGGTTPFAGQTIPWRASRIQ